MKALIFGGLVTLVACLVQAETGHPNQSTEGSIYEVKLKLLERVASFFSMPASRQNYPDDILAAKLRNDANGGQYVEIEKLVLARAEKYGHKIEEEKGLIHVMIYEELGEHTGMADVFIYFGKDEQLVRCKVIFGFMRKQ